MGPWDPGTAPREERQPQQAMRLREGTKAAAPRRRRGGGYNMIWFDVTQWNMIYIDIPYILF